MIKEFVADEILTLPEIKKYAGDINVLLTGSRAVGGYTDDSDIDLDILCPQAIFSDIQRNFYNNGKTPSINAAFYILTDSDYKSYFGEIPAPHFSIIPEERLINRIKKYDEVQMWIFKNAVKLFDNGISGKITDDMLCFQSEELLKKLKKYYLMFLYNVIDIYPSHANTEETKHIAAFSIYSGLIELYKFCFLAEKQAFPYTEKLINFVKTTKIYKECADTFNEIYLLLNNLSMDDAWERLERARGMVLYDDVYESSEKLGELMNEALLSNGCDDEWVKAGYDNIDELLYGVDYIDR
jgi:predicted nucleotidyltransferase